jgi:hypothetical protein
MTTANTTPVTRTTAGLRSALLDELDAIRAGKSNPSRANAVARVATGVVDTLRVEMDSKRHLVNVGKSPDEDIGSVSLI